jgi:hypothetical protein
MTTNGDTQSPDMAPADAVSVYVQTAQSLGINLDGRITLHGVAATTLQFSTRPYRLTGAINTDDFISTWGEGDDTFAENPPNALISVADGNDVSNVIVILSDPKLSDGDLSYAIDLSDGSLTPADGPVTAVIA